MSNETALARIDHDTSLEPATLSQLREFAETFAVSDLLPKHLRGKPADVAITVMHGRELGLTPMQAISGIFVVEGRPSLSATTAVALVKRSTVCEYFQCTETTDKRATYETKRRGDPKPTTLTFTIEDAARAGLVSKGTWKSYPAAMLRNRASLALARDVYPDVVANILSEDEADEIRGQAHVAPPVAAYRPPVVTLTHAQANAAEATTGAAPSLLGRIETAPTLAALAALVGELQTANEGDKSALRDAYKARKAALTAPAPAPVETPRTAAPVTNDWGSIIEAGATVVEREPGADDGD